MKTNVSLEKAKELKEKGKYEESLQLLENLLNQHRDNVSIKKALIETLFSYGGYLNDEMVLEYEKAKISFERIIEIEPNNYRAMYNLGIAHFNLEENEKALNLFKKALIYNPDYEYCYYNIGLIHESEKHFEEALECYEKALSIDENFVYAVQAKKSVRDVLDFIKREQAKVVEDKSKGNKREKDIDFKKLKSLLNVSRKVRIDMIRMILGLSENEILTLVIEWCKNYGFEIDGDFLLINKESLPLLIKEIEEK